MFFNYNGKLVKSVQIDIDNRSFLYGDGLFERLRLFNGQVFNRTNHLKRLIFSLEKLSLTLPISVDHLFDKVEQLAQTNYLSASSGARITIFRNAGGLYTPQTTMATYIIESFRDDDTCFVLDEGIRLGIYDRHLKPKSTLSNIKSSSANFYVLASLEKKENMLDEVLLLNDEKRPIEGSNSNIFIVNNNKVFTPPLSDGPLAGCMRSLLLKQFDITEKTIEIKDIHDADEIFFSNCNGIRWVSVFGSKTNYQNEVSTQVVEFLNTLI